MRKTIKFKVLKNIFGVGRTVMTYYVFCRVKIKATTYFFEELFWDHVGIILTLVWDYVGIILEVFWDYARAMLDLF